MSGRKFVAALAAMMVIFTGTGYAVHRWQDLMARLPAELAGKLDGSAPSAVPSEPAASPPAAPAVTAAAEPIQSTAPSLGTGIEVPAEPVPPVIAVAPAEPDASPVPADAVARSLVTPAPESPAPPDTGMSAAGEPAAAEPAPAPDSAASTGSDVASGPVLADAAPAGASTEVEAKALEAEIAATFSEGTPSDTEGIEIGAEASAKANEAVDDPSSVVDLSIFEPWMTGGDPDLSDPSDGGAATRSPASRPAVAGEDNGREPTEAEPAAAVVATTTLPPEPPVTAPAPTAAKPIRPDLLIMQLGGSGPWLVGGTAEPGAAITVRANGRALGTTTADVRGQWAVSGMPAMKPGDYLLVATARGASGVAIDSFTRLIVVPEPRLPEPTPAAPVASVTPPAAPAAPGSPPPAAEPVPPAAPAETAAADDVPEATPDLIEQAGEMAAAVSDQFSEWLGDGTPPAAEESVPTKPEDLAAATPPLPVPEAPAAPASDETVTAQAESTSEAAPSPTAPSTSTVPAEVENLAVSSVRFKAYAGAAEGRLTLSGRGTAGSRLVVSIDDSPLTETRVHDNGRWLIETDVTLGEGSHLLALFEPPTGDGPPRYASHTFTREDVLEPIPEPEAPAAGTVAEGDTDAVPEIAPTVTKKATRKAKRAKAAKLTKRGKLSKHAKKAGKARKRLAKARRKAVTVYAGSHKRRVLVKAGVRKSARLHKSRKKARALAAARHKGKRLARADRKLRKWYVVRAGDTLDRIARRHYGKGALARVKAANSRRIRSAHRIYPGQRILLP